MPVLENPAKGHCRREWRHQGDQLQLPSMATDEHSMPSSGLQYPKLPIWDQTRLFSVEPCWWYSRQLVGSEGNSLKKSRNYTGLRPLPAYILCRVEMKSVGNLLAISKLILRSSHIQVPALALSVSNSFWAEVARDSVVPSDSSRFWTSPSWRFFSSAAAFSISFF